MVINTILSVIIIALISIIIYQNYNFKVNYNITHTNSTYKTNVTKNDIELKKIENKYIPMVKNELAKNHHIKKERFEIESVTWLYNELIVEYNITEYNE